MTASFFQSPAAPFFFDAFRTFPAAGRMTVPVLPTTAHGVPSAQELTPGTVNALAHTFQRVFAETEALVLSNNGQVMTSLAVADETWTSIWGGRKHVILQNFTTGVGITFDRGGPQTRHMIGIKDLRSHRNSAGCRRGIGVSRFSAR